MSLLRFENADRRAAPTAIDLVGKTGAFGVVLTPYNQRAADLLTCAHRENSAVYT